MTTSAPTRPRLVLDAVTKRFPTGTVALTGPAPAADSLSTNQFFDKDVKLS